MNNKKMEIREGDKIYFKNHPTIIIGMRQVNGTKVKDLEKIYGKIERIERTTSYYSVYENKEILDDAEKRYLRAVIRPFKGNIQSIKKARGALHTEYLKADMKGLDSMIFPNFKEGTMYRGMNIDQSYTVKELGLYE